MSNKSVLQGCIDGRSLRVDCDYCKKQHIHGLTDDLLAGQKSHRSAHCPDPDSPYKKSGYYIQIAIKKEPEDMRNTSNCGK